MRGIMAHALLHTNSRLKNAIDEEKGKKIPFKRRFSFLSQTSVRKSGKFPQKSRS
jgi:hypothetical protein